MILFGYSKNILMPLTDRHYILFIYSTFLDNVAQQQFEQAVRNRKVAKT